MTDETPIQLVPGDALGAIERSQIDMQISTAKKYPRTISAFLAESRNMIAMNLETAESCNYKLKRKEKDGTMKTIEGPSVRLLEIAASAYGNLKYGSRIIAIDDDFVTAQGFAIDMQKNVYKTVEAKRAIRTREGRRFGTDMIVVTSNAAGAIALRNALNGLIPRAYIANLADYAKEIAVGDIKSLPERLQKAFDYFTKTLGVELAKVLAYLERPSLTDCTLSDLEDLQGLKIMLKEGDITLDAAFSPPKEATPTATVPDLTPKEEAPKPKKERVKAGVHFGLPNPEPPPTPPVAETPPPPPPTPEPTNELTPAMALASFLQVKGVPVDDFFDWLENTGKARRYGLDLATIPGIGNLPENVITDLLKDEVAMSGLIRTFGTNKT